MGGDELADGEGRGEGGFRISLCGGSPLYLDGWFYGASLTIAEQHRSVVRACPSHLVFFEKVLALRASCSLSFSLSSILYYSVRCAGALSLFVLAATCFYFTTLQHRESQLSTPIYPAFVSTRFHSLRDFTTIARTLHHNSALSTFLLTCTSAFW